MIARSRKRPRKALNGSPAEDLKYGDLTREQILAISPSFAHELNGDYDVEDLFRFFENNAKTFFAVGNGHTAKLIYGMSAGMETVIESMIAKFKRSEGGEFSNSRLTSVIRGNRTFQTFQDNLNTAFRTALESRDVRGDIYNINPGNIEFSPNISFGSVCDMASGLTVAIHDVWAYDIYLVEYEIVDTSTVRVEYEIIFYDHFGLDTNDVKKFGGPPHSLLYGQMFRQWFVLQRLEEYAYKPFVTKAVIRTSFLNPLSLKSLPTPKPYKKSLCEETIEKTKQIVDWF